jgi:type III secretion protein T
VSSFFSFLDPIFPSYILTVSMFALASARFVGVMSIMPLFTRAGIESILRAGIAVALSAPVVMVIVQQFPADTGGIPLWLMAFLMAKEILVGMAMGMLFSTPIWAISTAGDIIDSYRNASAANTTDPVNATEFSVFGTYLVILGLALFVSAGGLQIMIGAIYRSFAAWPLTSFTPPTKPETIALLYAFLDDVARLAFIIAAPILVLMVVIDITLMAFTRMNPQFQVFESSNSLKNLALVLILPIYISFFSEYMNVQWPKLFSNIDMITQP